MGRYLPLVASGVAVLLAGVVHGLWTDRWGQSTALTEAVARLERVPRDVGDWHGKDLELSAEEVQAAQLAGYCYRHYVHARSRYEVKILLLCGPPGPLAVHTPDVCFKGAGYRELGEPVSFQLPYGDEEADFRTLRMRMDETPHSGVLRIFWSWSTGGSWQAPGNPRLSFARHPALYKLYVLSTTAGETIQAKDDPAVDFMKEFLPRLDAILSSSP
jgi:hypothetical protein